MADFIPPEMKKKSFIRSKENVIATFDYFDVFRQLGYKTFYCVSLPTLKLLSPEVQPSQVLFENKSTASATPALVSEITWELNISNNFTLVGDAFLTCSVEEGDTAGSSGTKNYRMDFDVLKNTSVIGSGTGEDFGTSTTGFSGRLLTKATLTQTKFSKGDVLKLKTKLYFWTSAGGSRDARLWTDGESRGTTERNQYKSGTDSWDFKNRTDLVLKLPFKIDL
jgi:hypothetical protein